MALGRVDEVVRPVRAELVRHLVEDEELALGAEVGRVGDRRSRAGTPRPCRATRRGSFAYGSRVSGSAISQISESVGTSVDGIEDRARRVRHQQHVALGDPLPAADRRAVEAEPLLERGLVEAVIGSVTCCHVPSRSQNFRSTIAARVSCAHVERLVPGRRLAEVVLRPPAPTSPPPSAWTTKKAPGRSRVLRLHCLRARLRRRPRERTLAEACGSDASRVRPSPRRPGRRPDRSSRRRGSRRAARPSARRPAARAREHGEAVDVLRERLVLVAVIVNRSVQRASPHSHTISNVLAAPRSSWSWSMRSLTSRKSASFMPIRSVWSVTCADSPPPRSPATRLLDDHVAVVLLGRRGVLGVVHQPRQRTSSRASARARTSSSEAGPAPCRSDPRTRRERRRPADAKLVPLVAELLVRLAEEHLVASGALSLCVVSSRSHFARRATNTCDRTPTAAIVFAAMLLLG